jgi:signal transduction histidine kinase
MSFGRIRALQSESFRHAAIYAALFAVTMIILLALVYVTMDQAFKNDLLRAANDDLTSIRKAYVAGLPRKKGIHEAKEMIEDRLLAPDDMDRFLLQSDPRTWLAGNMPAMNPQVGEFHLRYPLNGTIHDVIGHGEFLSGNLYAFVGRDTAEAAAAEWAILRDFSWMLVGSVILAALSGLILGRSFLRRIDTISDTCRSIMAGRLGERIPAGLRNTELDRLSATINSMLDRIQVLMNSLKQVSNDIAHDMRTPLSHLRLGLERARSQTSEQYSATIESAIAEADQVLEMFAALLRIAELEASARHVGFQNIDLVALLNKAHDMYKPVMDDAGHPFEIEARSTAIVCGDPALLLQMITNLLDNANIHTPAGTPISISAAYGQSGPVITVSDEGPGIPAEDREKVFRRFYRREQSRTSPGSGLGLSLVSVIAELHGAVVELADNAPGLRITVKFPAIVPASSIKVA